MTELTIVPYVTANIGRGVATEVAKRNIVKVRRAFQPLKPLVGWQEIDADDSPQEHALIKQVFDKGYEHGCFAGREPISVPTEYFEVGRSSRVLIQEGVGHDEPGPPTGAKFLNTTILRPLNCKHRIAVVNTHFPNFEVTDPRWQKCLQALEEHLGKLAEQGMTTLWNGDTNANLRKNMPKLHPTERRLFGQGNDYAGIIPGGVRVRVHGTGEVNLTVDGHNARWAKLSFRDR